MLEFYKMNFINNFYLHNLKTIEWVEQYLLLFKITTLLPNPSETETILIIFKN